MPDEIYVSPNAFSGAPPNVVLVGGVCYRQIGPRDVPPTVLSVADEFTSCEACESVTPTLYVQAYDCDDDEPLDIYVPEGSVDTEKIYWTGTQCIYFTADTVEPGTIYDPSVWVVYDECDDCDLPVACNVSVDIDQVAAVVSGVESCGCVNCGARVAAWNSLILDVGRLNGTHVMEYEELKPDLSNIPTAGWRALYIGDFGKLYMGTDANGTPDWGGPNNNCSDKLHRPNDIGHWTFNVLVVRINLGASGGWSISAVWYIYADPWTGEPINDPAGFIPDNFITPPFPQGWSASGPCDAGPPARYGHATSSQVCRDAYVSETDGCQAVAGGGADLRQR